MGNILITGSSGYIGQCLEATLKKRKILCIDKKIQKNFRISNFNKINLLNKKKLNNFFKTNNIKTIVHLAGQSLVDENINYKKYYENNIKVTENILSMMEKYKINNLVFSSTASLYAETNIKLTEKSKINTISKYSKTKLICEKLIRKKNINSIILRFFNVCSSLPNLNRGENHKPETHIIPLFINNILKEKKISIYGTNYSTKDGTCIRDFIHVKDICDAIIKSINYLNKNIRVKEIFNIANNKGYSVLDIIKEIEKISKLKAQKSIKEKRSGDVPHLVSSFVKAKRKLKWYPKNSNLKKIIKDEIDWQKNN
jgi:UDP-glucose 4-epimerase